MCVRVLGVFVCWRALVRVISRLCATAAAADDDDDAQALLEMHFLSS